MAAASAAPRVNRRVPSRSGLGGVTAVTVPSAPTWQVTPAGQAPSRTAPVPVRRPASRIPASRRAVPWPGAAISVTPGPAAPGAGPASAGSSAPLRRARVSWRASSSLRAASSVAGTARPGIVAGPAPGSSRAASAAGMIRAGSPVPAGGAWASRAARIARAAGSAPGPVRPRPPRAAISMSTGVSASSPRTPAGTVPGGSSRRAGCSGPGSGASPGSWPGAAVPPSASGAGRASYRSAYGSRQSGRRRPGRRPGRCPGPGLRPAAGAGGRAARRRALMTSGSGGVSGWRVLGGPGRGR